MKENIDTKWLKHSKQRQKRTIESTRHHLIYFFLHWTLVNGREMLKFNKSKYISKKAKAKKIE